MILRAGMNTRSVLCIDRVTQEKLDLVCEIDLDTMRAKTYRKGPDGRALIGPDGLEAARFDHPNPVMLIAGGIPLSKDWLEHLARGGEL